MRTARLGISAFLLCSPFLLLWSRAGAATGTEGAAFLEIPVGARPAALGDSYAALASDAYAPIFNPSGLGFLSNNQLSGMHLDYLDSMAYEYASFVHPFSLGHSFGVAVQYFRPGSTPGTDLSGNSTGDFSGSYGAYSLAYGRMVGPRLALGLTAKFLHAAIADYTASAYGFDAGAMYQLNERCTLAAVVANLGTSLNFLDQPDALALSYQLGAAYRLTRALQWTMQGDYDRSGASVFRTGAEWWIKRRFFLRAGYKTDTVKELSALSGLTTGAGFQASLFEFDYAWLPLGDLGNTQYFSVVAKWGEAEYNRNLIAYHAPAHPHPPYGSFYPYDVLDDHQIMEELSASEEIQEAKLSFPRQPDFPTITPPTLEPNTPQESDPMNRTEFQGDSKLMVPPQPEAPSLKQGRFSPYYQDDHHILEELTASEEIQEAQHPHETSQNQSEQSHSNMIMIIPNETTK